MTAPTPPMTPSTSMSFRGPSAMVRLTKRPNHSTPMSIQSIGYWPSVKVTSNIR